MEEIEPLYVEHGKLYTLREAAALLGRNLKVVQRWHAEGRLPSRFVRTTGHRAALVSHEDLMAVADFRKKGVVRPRRTRTFVTTNGAKYKLRATRPGRDHQPPTP